LYSGIYGGRPIILQKANLKKKGGGDPLEQKSGELLPFRPEWNKGLTL
jgi:hypothetical protein